MPAAAPSGQVTLVFTDLQGSTELWERLGDRFQPVLARHHAILRERIEARCGYEVKTEGDAFMVAFARASDAVAFAMEVQEALAAEAWPSETGELRVRAGVHAGEPLCIPDSATGRPDYYGPAVNRAARIAAAAHGGQVLVSSATWELAAGGRGDLKATDLGEHRLKGLERAERLWQVLPAALASRTFPPLRTLSARPTNLVPPPTSFVGRERELSDLAALFADPATRLVTLTGPGGAGKTRLSMRLGADLLDRFEGGVWFADLSAERDPAGVAEAVARGLGLPATDRDNPVERLSVALAARKPLLLVLDNFEQAVGAAPATVGIWRDRAPAARFLVTSRSLLGIAGEREYEVPPLGLPPRAGGTTARLEAYDGVRLFLERARESDPGFRPEAAGLPAIADLCARLDGIPLAIELAAARVRVLRPADMLARLDQRFQILRSTRRDLPPRQQTLLGAVDWSYSLLEPWERAAFHQLCCFRGSFSLPSAEAVLRLPPEAPDAATVVQTLREKSFLRSWDAPGGVRFGMYQTIREFGEARRGEAMPAGELEALAERQAKEALLAVAADRGVPGGRLSMRNLELEQDNLREAHRWAIARRRADVAHNAADLLWIILMMKGPLEEARCVVAETAALTEGADPERRVSCLLNLAAICDRIGDVKAALAHAREAETLAASAGLQSARADAVFARHRYGGGPTDVEAALAELDEAGKALAGENALQSALVRARCVRATPQRALAILDEAETQLAPEPFAAVPLRLDRVKVLDALGDYERARQDLDLSESHIRGMGDRVRLAEVLLMRGRIAVFTGSGEEGIALMEEAEGMLREVGARAMLARCLGTQGGTFVAARDFERARVKFEEFDRLARETRQEPLLASSLNLRAVAHIRLGEHAQAERLLAESEDLARQAGAHVELAQARSFVADLRIAQQRWADALPAIDEAIRLYELADARPRLGPARIARGLVLLELGRTAEAVDSERAGLRDLPGEGSGSDDVTIRAWIYLGRALAASGGRAEAAEIARRCRTLVEQMLKEAPAVGEALRPLLGALESAL